MYTTSTCAILYIAVMAARPYLVDTFNFRNIGDSVGSVFVIVGFNLSLKEKDRVR